MIINGHKRFFTLFLNKEVWQWEKLKTWKTGWSFTSMPLDIHEQNNLISYENWRNPNMVARGGDTSKKSKKYASKNI
jgi:hypothetical protein